MGEDRRLGTAKEEFDIATGYYNRWQKAEARIAQLEEALRQQRDRADKLASAHSIDVHKLHARLAQLTNVLQLVSSRAPEYLADGAAYMLTTSDFQTVRVALSPSEAKEDTDE